MGALTGIYRITHYRNLPFILRNGLHCPASEIKDPGFEPIGFPTLVEYRNEWRVPVKPFGTLAEYIPFYFRWRSPMLYVIAKGNDPEVIRTPQEEIVYLASTAEKIKEINCGFVFTDRHAKLELANFYNDLSDLAKLNWEVIKTDYWGRQYGPELREIKQAEFLVHKHAPASALIGIGCMNEKTAGHVRKIVSESDLKIDVKVKENWYF